MSHPAYTVREERISPHPDDVMRSAYSTKDGSYIGNVQTAQQLTRKGILPEAIPGNKVASIGFCEAEQKWYGWSHRAIFGFGVGHNVKKGDINHIADTPEGLITDRGDFFRDISDACAQMHMDECQILPDRSGIRILHTPMMIPVAESIDEAIEAIGEMRDMPIQTIFEDEVSIVKCGRGEWTAETLVDARQMAIDFANAVC